MYKSQDIGIISNTVSLGGQLNSLYGDVESLQNIVERLAKKLEPLLPDSPSVFPASLKDTVKQSQLVESTTNIGNKIFEIKNHLEFLENSIQV